VERIGQNFLATPVRAAMLSVLLALGEGCPEKLSASFPKFGNVSGTHKEA
jgi:hypothetical protein